MKLTDFLPKSLLTEDDDAIALLEADHDKVLGLFKRFDELKDGRAHQEKEQVVAEACRELTVHTTLEEEVFYPAVRGPVADDDLMNEAIVEHAGAKSLIHDLEGMRAADGMFNAKFTVLSEYVKHHIKEERGELFPKARATGVDMAALGRKMLLRKQELQKGNHQASPRAAPAKRKPRVRKSAARPAR